MEQIFDKIKELLAADYEINMAEITMQSKLRVDLGLDSLDLTEAILAIEDAFGIEFDEDEVDSFETIEDMCRYIEQATA